MIKKLIIKLRLLKARLLQKSGFNTVYYINSPQTLPPPLSKAEEERLTEENANGDQRARDILVEHNLRLVVYIAKKFENSGVNIEDLISIGTIGLIKAVDSFRYSKGARFATYSAKCIQNEILMYFRSRKKLASEVSMNDTIDTDRDGNPLTYLDIIKIDDTIADDIDLKIQVSKAYTYINNNLTPREREIIVMRYGLGNNVPMTQREVAKILGISRSYVSRIEKLALEKLRCALS